MKLIDITGQRFGRLVVLQKLAPRKGGGSDWRCRCDCGNECVAIGSNIRKGDTTSCGCVAHEWAVKLGSDPALIAQRAAKQIRHGHKKRSGMSPEYATWLRMKKRCENPTEKDYPNWGGRGIRVCERWQTFDHFLADMGTKPSATHSIDRIDPNGNYEPRNCRWATQKQQNSEHRRNMRVIEMDGLRFENLKAACTHYGIGLTTAHNRLACGYTIEATLKTPTHGLPNSRTRESYLRKPSR